MKKLEEVISNVLIIPYKCGTGIYFNMFSMMNELLKMYEDVITVYLDHEDVSVQKEVLQDNYNRCIQKYTVVRSKDMVLNWIRSLTETAALFPNEKLVVFIPNINSFISNSFISENDKLQFYHKILNIVKDSNIGVYLFEQQNAKFEGSFTPYEII